LTRQSDDDSFPPSEIKKDKYYKRC